MPSQTSFGPAGYSRLRERYSLSCLPNHVESTVSYGTRHTHTESSTVRETYPRTYWPGEGDFAHIKFALKREGIHLQLLHDLLPKLSVKELTDFVRSKPTGANARRIWFLYEEFTGKRVEELPDAFQGNYVDLLNPKHYYTGSRIRNFVAPRPQEISDLMSAFLKASRQILESRIDPVVAAAIISYAFVFLHPFTDGNGRVHCFLIHYVLTQTGFAPNGLVFPVSAIMLHRIAHYDASLESFSNSLLPLVDYELDSVVRMTVKNDTRKYYRYIDFTKPAEALYSFVEDTIEKELPSEIQFLRQYDDARRLMRDVVDLPNRHADLFVRVCLQNNGKLSKAKRQLSEFRQLSDDEISGLEAAVDEAYSTGNGVRIISTND